MKVIVSGSSDGLVEIDGDLYEEFGGYDDAGYLAFGDGTLLEIEYTELGLWKINVLHHGTASIVKTFEANDSASSDYSDRVELEGDLGYALFAGASECQIVTRKPVRRVSE